MTVDFCYTTGSIATGCGGIMGGSDILTTGTVRVQNSYSTGDITGTGRGIYGPFLAANTTVADNCICKGVANGTGAGTTTNCYVYDTWDTTVASTSLSPTTLPTYSSGVL